MQGQIVGYLALVSAMMNFGPASANDDALEEDFSRNCPHAPGIHKKSCYKMFCQLEVCFHDNTGPVQYLNKVLNDIFIMNHAREPGLGGVLKNWTRTDPEEWCNYGLRKGSATIQQWRRSCYDNPLVDFSLNHGVEGSLKGGCWAKNQVHCP
ncbi:hypothetical protein BCR37DRAFT_378573 [Protomyces lactucae-debilis]|uniref:Uncharacterized protein n=1 Tax=Protomyces lactucae-debilis TaxID=2754530 RepID=A0A1Y2FI15_PROLT|nr:uncharacterized protein BCR37DRAFT_378573 [Protomyces lactucae-debilis]ORY83601.1 hypothetical protein BCR37DRAFT_378573 [Protomyces lactucae-debilis]